MTITRQGPTPVGQRLRAHKIPSQRRLPPELEEWDDALDGDQDEIDIDIFFELRSDR
jgi:hypothetical protein